MPFSEPYRRQASLLVRLLPLIAAEDCFALKGGTAINLFLRNMPRLSVDIDLTYVPVQPRAQSLQGINAAMDRIAKRLDASPFVSTAIRHAPPTDSTTLTKLTARYQDAQVKIEVTPVLRGCVYEPQMMSVAAPVEETFGFAETRVVSFPDVYASKIVAALDRQHPRDLFDIRELLNTEGITDELRRALIVYLISHNRPTHEVINPARKDIRHEYERGFLGMTNIPVTLDQLMRAREHLISEATMQMPDSHRQFLISFTRGEPDWAQLGIDHASTLPAIRWKQQNLNKLNSRARNQLTSQLENALK